MEPVIIGWIVSTFIAMLIAAIRKVSLGYTFLWCLLIPLAGIIYASAVKPKKTAKQLREESFSNTVKHLSHLKTLKEEGILSEEEFEEKKKMLKSDIAIPPTAKYITIQHLQGRPETITIKQWEKIKDNFGQENYKILNYH